MSAQTIGLLSGGLVFLSIVPYAFRTYQYKIRPVPTSWSLWSLIGLAILLTYRGAGAAANVWPAIFGFVNPVIITLLSIVRRGQWRRPNVSEKLCFLLGLVSLGMWLWLRQNPQFVPCALYVAILADFCAALPTILFVRKEPSADRPFAWVLFAIGYFLSVFAIPVNTVGNWILPLYMTAVTLAVAFPLVLYRLRAKVPLQQWV